ncbi:MAG: 5-guanidino-2-oxopentanoate decarboxylase [Pseudomonadota bacterium]
MSQTQTNKQTLGEYLIRCLEAQGTEYVFGIPGVHTVSLYRGLDGSTISHITPRHEQGAGFMADGYARISGKPGVCFVITGPGLSNISTAMLQARADSVPMLVISAVNDLDRTTRGNLHEMPDQAAFAKTAAVQSSTVTNGGELRAALEQAYHLFSSGRPGPIHIELPLAAINAECADEMPNPTTMPAPTPSAADLNEAATQMEGWSKPLILAGGGTRSAGADILALAERLSAPLITTVNARSAFPNDHPLVLHGSASLPSVRKLIDEADGIFAVGTELGPTDYDMYETLGPIAAKALMRVDIDAKQARTNADPALALIGDCACIAKDLTERLSQKQPGFGNRIAEVRMTVRAELSDDYRQHIQLLSAVRDAVSDTVFIGDSTQLVYAGNMAFAPGKGGDWFNSATGFGTLGYGLSAAMGAKLADPAKPVLCLIGDGGLQFALGELGTLRDLAVPVVVLVWNDAAYGEIASAMRTANIAQDVIAASCHVPAPDFAAIAKAYDLEAITHVGTEGLSDLVINALASKTSFVIDARIAK